MTPGKASTTWSISLEELALGLALINAPAQSRRLLTAAYKDQSEELTEARLTTASHALMAAGLCQLTPEGILHIDPAFEKALYPLVKYTSFINGSLLTGEAQAELSIALTAKDFTGRVVIAGVIENLTHAPLKELPEYLVTIMDAAGKAATPRKLTASITLAGLQEAAAKGADVAKLLAKAGLPAKDAGLLAADFAAPRLNVTLTHVRAADSLPETELEKAPRSTLLLLAGEKNCWVFSFPKPGADAKGSIQLVNRETLEALLVEFIA